MPKLPMSYKVLTQLKKLDLKLEETINHTIYKFEEDFIAFFDFDGEDQYKGIIIFSDDKEKIGDIHWYYIDNSMKEYLVLKDTE